MFEYPLAFTLFAFFLQNAPIASSNGHLSSTIKSHNQIQSSNKYGLYGFQQSSVHRQHGHHLHYQIKALNKSTSIIPKFASSQIQKL